MEDKRKEQRYSKRLRAVIITDENGKLVRTHGKTHDISLGGVSIISDYDLNSRLPVTVYILVEQGDPKHPPLIFEASCKIVNSVLSGQQGGFRIGCQFIKFIGEGEKILKKHLLPSARPAPAKPPAAQPPPVETPQAPPAETGQTQPAEAVHVPSAETDQAAPVDATEAQPSGTPPAPPPEAAQTSPAEAAQAPPAEPQ